MKNNHSSRIVPAPHYVETGEPKFRRLRIQVVLGIELWLLFSLFAWIGLGDDGVVYSFFVFAVAVIWLQLQFYHRTQIDNFRHYKQLEALTYLTQILSFKYPLPPMRIWAISPDLATVITDQIVTHHPKVIVELGSGISTIISSYTVHRTDLDAHIYAIDHEQEFANKTRDIVALHAMSNRTTVLHAPLQPIVIKNYRGQWYNPNIFSDIERIDLLFIDGPPGKLQSLARYPALPMLYDKLSENAIIIMDDFERKDEHEIANRWMQEFELELVEVIANEKGAVVLRKTSSNKPTNNK